MDEKKAGFIGILGIILIIFSMLGFVTNIVWTFHQTLIAKILLGVIGIVFPPIGIVHGLITLF